MAAAPSPERAPARIRPTPRKAYEAYYGPVEIDDTKNIFAITVESSLVRNGQRLERKFEVTGDRLAAEGWRVSYDHSENSSVADVLQESFCLID